MEHRYEMTTARLRLYAPSLAEVTDILRGARAAVGARIGADLSDEWWRGPSLIRLLPNLHWDMTRESGDARWIWLVIDPEIDHGIAPAGARVIGDVGFHGPLRSGAAAEIGYSLVPGARGHGYATEATAAVIQWAFVNTQIASVIAQIDPANAASQRVAAKLGMRPLPPMSDEYLCFGLARPSA